MDEQKTAYVGIGSNKGDTSANFRWAIKQLEQSQFVDLCRISSEIITKPLAGKQQADYRNAVIKITTSLSAFELLDYLKKIESAMGRVMQKQRWQARTIDLDILFYDSEVIDTDILAVPHRQLHLRSFVLSGLCQLAPEFVHPVLNETVRVLADRLNRQDFYYDSKRPQLISIAGLIGAGKTTLARGLADVFDCALIKEQYSKNPYLPKVYAGQKDLALDSQLFFLNSRSAQLSAQKLTPGEKFVSDYVIDKELIYAQTWLESEDLEKYKYVNEKTCCGLAEPAVTVYLKIAPSVCLRRIKNRNRPYEKKINLDFLTRLESGYEKLFDNWKKSPLLVIDSADTDYRKSENVKTLAEKIKLYLS